MLELLVPAVVGGIVEALVGAGIEKTPAVAARVRRVVDLVERQDPTVVDAAIRRAVDAAKADLLHGYNEKRYDGNPESSVKEMLALLRHPPFAEEVTHKLIFRGQPDFERLRLAYIKLDGASERWTALEAPLLDFFDAIERYLLADPLVGPLLRDLQQLTILTRLDQTGQIVADASRQIVVYQQRIAESGEEIAGGVGQLVRLSGRHDASLRELVALLTVVIKALGVPEFRIWETGVLSPAEIAYLRVLRRDCNRIPLAEDSRDQGSTAKRRAELANVYVDLQTTATPTLDQVFDRLGVPTQARPKLRVQLARESMKGDTDRDASEQNMLDNAAYIPLLWREPDELKKHPLFRYAMSVAQLRAAGRPLTALEALDAHRHLVLLGNPGGGKSTFVNHLAYRLAGTLLDEEPDGGDTPSPAHGGLEFPLRVILRRLSGSLTIESRPDRKLLYAAICDAAGLD